MTTYTAADTRTMQNPKTAFVVTIVLVFLVGAVVGALAMNLGAHNRLHRAAFWTDQAETFRFTVSRKNSTSLPNKPSSSKPFSTIFRVIIRTC